MATTAPAAAPGRERARAGWLDALVAFALVTVIVTFAVWLGRAGSIASPASHDLAPYPGSGLFGGWFRYDGRWYDMIATQGYSYNGPATQSSSAFFPAYPTVLWALHAVTGLSVKLLGTLVTLACGAGVVVVFRRWCDDRVDPLVARMAMITLLLYPYAFYLMGALYADALFLLATISAFLLLERGHPVLAGLAGAVATGARPVGIAVVVGLVAVTLWRKGTVARRDGRLRIDLHTLRPADGGVLLAMGGLLGWMTYLGVRFGHPLAFEEVQQAPGWDQGGGPHTWFKVLWFEQVKNLPGRIHRWLNTGDTLDFQSWIYAAGVVLQGLLVLGFLWLAWQAWRRFGWGYGVYSFALLAIPLIATKDFQGAGRYLLAAFPCYLALAELLAPRPLLRRATWAVGGILLVGWAFAFRPWLLRCVTCMANFESLTIFYPMWNEEATIERAVGAAFEAGELLVAAGEIGRYDVLIVNDASTDRTGEIADALAAGDPRVSVVHHPTNRKLGGSLKTGFANATGELILYTDADLPFDMAEASKAVRLMRIYEADIVSAYRFDRTGEGARRLVYSYVYNHLVQTMFGLRLRDMNFAFKLVRRSVFEHVHLHSEGSFIDVELLARAHRLGYRIVQFGVDYFPRTRGISTLSSNAVIATIIREMLELRTGLQALEPLSSEQLHHPEAFTAEGGPDEVSAPGADGA